MYYIVVLSMLSTNRIVVVHREVFEGLIEISPNKF